MLHNRAICGCLLPSPELCSPFFLSLYQFDTICDFHSFDGAWHPPQWSIKMCAAKIVFTMLACWFPSRVLETWHRNEKKKRVENTSDCMTFARHEISHFEVSGATILLGKIILHGRFINFKPKFQALTLLIFAERNQRYPLGLYLFGESKTIQWKTINIHSVYLLFAVSPGSHFWADIKTHEKQTSERKIN